MKNNILQILSIFFLLLLLNGCTTTSNSIRETKNKIAFIIVSLEGKLSQNNSLISKSQNIEENQKIFFKGKKLEFSFGSHISTLPNLVIPSDSEFSLSEEKLNLFDGIIYIEKRNNQRKFQVETPIAQYTIQNKSKIEIITWSEDEHLCSKINIKKGLIDSFDDIIFSSEEIYTMNNKKIIRLNKDKLGKREKLGTICISKRD